MTTVFRLDQLDYYDKCCIKAYNYLLTKQEEKIITEVFNKIDVTNTPTQAFFYGSRFTCYPSVRNTDVDVAIFTEGDSNQLEELLVGLGFSTSNCDDYDSPDEFCSFRKDTVNFILFYNRDLFQSTQITSEFVASNNITDKDERIEIFKLTDNITINARSFREGWV